MNDLIIVIGLIVHYIADFLLQTHEQAINKSSSNAYLVRHTSVYSYCWFAVMCIVFYFDGYNAPGAFAVAGVFFIITFFAHTITDYFTSRWAKKYFSKHDYHTGFCVVGFDQILHYLQLYFTYKLLAV